LGGNVTLGGRDIEAPIVNQIRPDNLPLVFRGRT
jgi:hypothetical protein